MMNTLVEALYKVSQFTTKPQNIYCNVLDIFNDFPRPSIKFYSYFYISKKKTSTNIIYILSYQINWTGQQLISSIPKRLKTVINIEHKQINKVLYI